MITTSLLAGCLLSPGIPAAEPVPSRPALKPAQAVIL